MNAFLAGMLASYGAAICAAVPQVVLVQNSGWMEPFYSDTKSEFRPLVRALVHAVAGAESEVVVLAFNQSVAQNKSPQLLVRGRDFSATDRAINAVTIAKKPGSTALADTDFLEAVRSTVTDYLGGNSAVIWIITNNKNSPNNSPETAKRNQEFYDLLHHEDSVRRVIAYPLKMAVNGRQFKANGLMVYAIAYGQAADDSLKALLAGQTLRRLFSEPPARLKPLNEEAVFFVPKGVLDTPGVSALLAPNNTVVIDFDVARKPVTAQLIGQFQNAFNPYQIDSARIRVEQVFQGESPLSVSVHPDVLSGLAAGALSPEVTLSITIPPLPSMFSPEIVFSSGYQTIGKLIVTNEGQKLSISPAFLVRMNEVFPGDPLPDLFAPSRQSNGATTDVPLVVRVNYPVWPLILVALLGLLLLATASLLIFAVRREQRISVKVNGMTRKIALRPFRKAELRDDKGVHIATVKRGISRARVVWAKEGVVVDVG